MREALAILVEKTGAEKLAQEAGKTALSAIGRSTADKLGNEVVGAAARSLFHDLASPASAKAKEISLASLEQGPDSGSIYPLLRISGLKNPRTVTVEAMDISTQRASLKFPERGKSRPLICLDDQPVGRFCDSGPARLIEFPFDIRTANLTLSNGKTFSVPERSLSVMPKWTEYDLKSHVPVLDSRAIAITREAQVDFKQMLSLKPGTELIDEYPFQKIHNSLTNGRDVFPLKRELLYSQTYRLSHVSDETWDLFINALDGKFASKPDLPGWVRLKYGEAKFQPMADIMSKLSGERAGRKDYPFQWLGDQLTNGIVSLPRIRPEGAQWRNLPIPAVPAPYWTPYLESLEGKYVNRIVQNLSSFIERNKQVREPKLSPFQEEVKEVILRTANRELWSGNENTAPGVRLGHGVMFTQPIGGGKKLYVLEQAERAVYLFKDRQDAERIATGEWLRTEARKAGNQFVVHSGDWKTKLEQKIRQLAKELTT